jgi:ABC-type branched-subunit amino acid transport system substrate-binding protein
MRLRQQRRRSQRPLRRKGVRIKVKWDERFDPEQSGDRLLTALKRNSINALISAGSYEHDVAVMRTVLDSQLNIPVLACVAAGLGNFRADLDDRVEGIVGTSQWEPGSEATPEIGPHPRDFAHRMRTQTRTGECDYIAAQAYAAGILAAAVLQKVGTCDQVRMREEFAKLRTDTLFGAFEIDATGRQVAHRMLMVQWHQGRKVTIERDIPGEPTSFDIPTGPPLLAAVADLLGLTRHPQAR